MTNAASSAPARAEQSGYGGAPAPASGGGYVLSSESAQPLMQ